MDIQQGLLGTFFTFLSAQAPPVTLEEKIEKIRKEFRENRNGDTELHLALRTLDLEILNFFLKEATLETFRKVNHEGDTPLSLSIKLNIIEGLMRSLSLYDQATFSLLFTEDLVPIFCNNSKLMVEVIKKSSHPIQLRNKIFCVAVDASHKNTALTLVSFDWTPFNEGTETLFSFVMQLTNKKYLIAFLENYNRSGKDCKCTGPTPLDIILSQCREDLGLVSAAISLDGKFDPKSPYAEDMLQRLCQKVFTSVRFKLTDPLEKIRAVLKNQNELKTIFILIREGVTTQNLGKYNYLLLDTALSEFSPSSTFDYFPVIENLIRENPQLLDIQSKYKGYTLLHQCLATRKHLAIIRLLTTDRNLKIKEKSSGFTPLLLASYLNKLDSKINDTLFLLSRNVDIYEKDAAGRSFLSHVPYVLFKVQKKGEILLQKLRAQLKKEDGVIDYLIKMNNFDQISQFLPECYCEIAAQATNPDSLIVQAIRKEKPVHQAILCRVFPELREVLDKHILVLGEKSFQNLTPDSLDPSWFSLLYNTESVENALHPKYLSYFSAVENKGWMELTKGDIYSLSSCVHLNKVILFFMKNNNFTLANLFLIECKLFFCQVDEEGRNVLHYACMYRNAEFLKTFFTLFNSSIYLPKLVQTRDKQGKYPFEILLSITPIWIEGIKILDELPSLADNSHPRTDYQIHLRDAFNQAFNLAFDADDVPLVKALRKVEKRQGRYLYFLKLLPAIKRKAWNVSNHFITEGDGLNESDNDENTPLHIAARTIFWVNNQEMTLVPALKKATEAYYKKLKEEFVKDSDVDEEEDVDDDDDGYNIHCKNNHGLTPLDVAVQAGYLLPMQKILEGEGKSGLMPESYTIEMAMRSFHFHLLCALFSKYSTTHHFLQKLEEKLPGKVIRAEGQWIDPMGGDAWLPAIKTLPADDAQWNKILEIPLIFHDVRFAHKLFDLLSEDQFTANISFIKNGYDDPMLSDWLRWERYAWKHQVEINLALFEIPPKATVPEAPSYVTFDFADKTIISLLSKVHFQDPRKPGYLRAKGDDIEKGVKIFIKDIRERNLDEGFTGKKGTPECEKYYQNLENLLKLIALLFSEESELIKAIYVAEREEGLKPLPKLDADHCATVMHELAKSTKVCATERANTLFALYHQFHPDASLETSASNIGPWEIHLRQYLEEYKEKVVQKIISLQKEPDGGELQETAHVAVQVRQYLAERGVRQQSIASFDPYSRSHITKESILNTFDKFFCVSGLVDLIDEAINGDMDSDGKRVDLTKKKPVFDSERVFTWLIDNCTTRDEMEHHTKGNELVAVLEKIKKKEVTGDEVVRQFAWANQRARELGATVPLSQQIGKAYAEANELAGKTRSQIEKTFFYNSETAEWGKEGILNMLLHPKIGFLKKKTVVAPASTTSVSPTPKHRTKRRREDDQKDDRS